MEFIKTVYSFRFSPNRPLGRFGLVVAMSMYFLSVTFHRIFSEASHWPSDFFLMQIAYLSGIGASIRIGREIRCLPYAGFLSGICSSNTGHNKLL